MLECCQKGGADVVTPSNLGARSAIYTSGVTVVGGICVSWVLVCW